jgi:hypothetical protein
VRFLATSLVALVACGHHQPAGSEHHGCDKPAPNTDDTVCYCDGYHGGIPPQKGVDYSHWECGKVKHRTDGCPDNIAEGQTCTGTPGGCNALEGTSCGQFFECKAGHWDGHRNTCYEIP